MLSFERVVSLASESEPNPILPHTTEIIVGLVAFSILYYVLNKAVVPRFEKAFKERANAIEGGIARAEQAQAEASAALANYQAQLADARGEAAKLREDARVQGAAIIEEMRAQAQAEADRIVASAHNQIQSERQQAVIALRNEMGTLAIELASKIVGEALDDQARRITSWVALAAAPTMVAGIYGMNFDHMPELRWTYSYPVLMVFLGLFTFGLWRKFKSSGWL